MMVTLQFFQQLYLQLVEVVEVEQMFQIYLLEDQVVLVEVQEIHLVQELLVQEILPQYLLLKEIMVEVLVLQEQLQIMVQVVAAELQVLDKQDQIYMVDLVVMVPQLQSMELQQQELVAVVAVFTLEVFLLQEMVDLVVEEMVVEVQVEQLQLGLQIQAVVVEVFLSVLVLLETVALV
jgi:hypothetical protein